MVSNNRYDGINEYAVRVIAYRARRLIGKAGFRAEDLEDIEQELVVDFLERSCKYDPAKAELTTFIDRIVTHKILSMIEKRSAARRDYRKTSLLSNCFLREKEGFWNTLLNLISTDEYLDRMGYQDVPHLEQQQLRIDLDMALKRLSEDEQQLLELLKKMSLSEASRELGIARTTLIYRLQKIRKRLSDRGLRDYWSK